AEELDAMLALSKDMDIPPINLSKYLLDIQFVILIPEEIARTYQVVVLAKTEQELTVAISDPFNITAIDTLKSLVKTNIHLVLATPSDIIKTIDKFYSILNLEKKPATREAIGQSSAQEDKKEMGFEIKAVTSEDFEDDINEITKISQGESIVTIVNDILSEAVKRRASDIHIEPYPQELRLRYRIDGILHEVKSLPKDVERALVARIKIMSYLDITQRRLAQDGRLSLFLEKRKIDCRVSVLPISSGEKIVLRLLEKGGVQINLEKLGFSPNVLEAFTKAMARPNGMVLLTGPTGSGKSTTLYALLNTLDKVKKNIITIEDPAEYQMQGVTQIQIKPEIGLTFVNSLRAVLRQNPNVIMIGEIRDFETVDIAIKAALTGHLILSTLHTNDAPSAITRLMNMQVEPFLISSTLLLIAAQRLCRRICESCKVPYEIPVEKLVGLPADFKENKAILYRGKGCQRCNNTGYFDRMPVVQALFIDDTIKDMILRRVSLNEMREYAHSKGMKTLREDAMGKVLKGDISLEEALRITPEG
ncbi:MAG: GspE/PulE family protein, partial [Candidatus Omnitrophota bacterium]